MSLSLFGALDIFQDNIQDIITAMSINLATEISEEKKEAEILGTSGIADAVRSIRMENRFGSYIQRLNSVRSHHNALLHPTQGRITPSDVERAKEYPIHDLYVGKLVKRGKVYVGLCPFHTEKTPSFNIKNNRFKCYGCDVFGDSVDFYMRTHNVSFIQAVKQLI